MNNSLHPNFPIVEGDYHLTKNWMLTLKEKFNRRIDDASMVLWRPGLTFWIDVYGNDKSLSPDDQISEFTKESSMLAYDKIVKPGDELSKMSYKLDEDHDGKKIKALYGFVASPSGIMLLGVYADSDEDLTLAQEILETVRPV